MELWPLEGKINQYEGVSSKVELIKYVWFFYYKNWVLHKFYSIIHQTQKIQVKFSGKSLQNIQFN